MGRVLVQQPGTNTTKASTEILPKNVIIVDEDLHQLRLHDGTTPGGHVIGSSGSGNNSNALLSFIWADHELNHPSWLNANTFSWQSGAVYHAAYEHLVADVNSAPGEDIGGVVSGQPNGSDTIGDITIVYYSAKDGHKVCMPDQESKLIALYEATGIAWYYIVDTTNQRFKLPRTKFGFTGLRDKVGGHVEPGLPNITGTFSTVGNGSGTGVFVKDSHANGHPWDGTGIGADTFSFNASRSSSIYGNGSTVQQPATQMYLYFYVGNFEQAAIEQTAGINAEMFNGKADLDLGNVPAASKATAISWCMPDYSAVVSMTSGSAAPKNGWAIAHGANANVEYSVNNVSVAQGNWYSGAWSGNWNLQIMVSAGDVVTGGSWKFIPCKGVN